MGRGDVTSVYDPSAFWHTAATCLPASADHMLILFITIPEQPMLEQLNLIASLVSEVPLNPLYVTPLIFKFFG